MVTPSKRTYGPEHPISLLRQSMREDANGSGDKRDFEGSGSGIGARGLSTVQP